MNRTTRSMFSALALAALLAASVPAQADEGIAVRVATGVGRVIAAQGNAALATIRAEIKDTVKDTLQQFLPADSKSDAQDDTSTKSAPTA
jgi:hypothetical protein